MATARRAVPAVLLLVLAGGALWMWRILDGRSKPIAVSVRPVASEVAAPGRSEPSGSAEVSRSRDAAMGIDGAIADESPPLFPATRRSGVFVVEIVDRNGAPAAGAGARIDSWIGGHFADLAIADDRDVHRHANADGAGRIEIAALAEGAYCVTAHAADGRSARAYFDFTLARSDPLRIVLSEKPQHSPGVEITVVGGDGSPVADAEVELDGATLDRGVVGSAKHPALVAKSDATGVARFDGVRWLAGMVFAKTPDGRTGAKSLGDVSLDDAPEVARAEDPPVEQGTLDSDEEEDLIFQLMSDDDSGTEHVTFHSGEEFDDVAQFADARSMALGFALGTDEHSTSKDFTSTKLIVRKPGRIAGSIESVPDAALADAALAGASIEAWIATSQDTWESSHGRGTTVPVEGRDFVFDALPVGEYSLVLHAPGGARLVLDRSKVGVDVLENSVQPPLANVEEGATTKVALHITTGGSIRGRVHRADGSPIAGARVVATFGPWMFAPCDAFVRHQMHVWSFGPDSGLEGLHPLTHVVGVTDARGEYRLTGLQPGLHRIMVTARGMSFDRREWTAIVDGKTLEFDHVLEEAGAIQGIAASSAYLGVMRVGEATPVALATLFEGRSFTFGGLRPGAYVLSDFPEERGTPPVERGRAVVEAGRTTFVDLTDAPGPVEIAGRVVDGHGGVPTAIVEYESTRRRVDGDGSFTFHSNFASENRFFGIVVEIAQLRESFGRRLDATPSGAAWHGSLRVGDETLRIEVRDASGSPVAGTVELQRSVSNPGDDEPARIWTEPLPLDANGALVIEHLMAGHYAVRARGPGGVDLKSKVDVPRAGVLHLEFDQGGTLVVRVLASDGRPLPYWRVTASTFVGDPDSPDEDANRDAWTVTRSAVAQRDGVARLHHVRSGSVTIRAEKLGSLDPDGPEEAPIQRAIELSQGQTVEVELRAKTSANDDR